MRDIFAASSRQVIADLARTNVLLAFDYDGTLAPIVDEPEHAGMRQATRELLAELAEAYPCAVISGRSREDVARRLRLLKLVGVVGNHGLEPWPRAELFAADVQRWRPVLEDGLTGLEGVVVEDKGFSLAIHYRHATQRAFVRARILEIAESLEGARILGGKEIVNLVPANGPTKGVALEIVRQRVGCDTAIYLGDDDTDEDVFKLAGAGRVLGIRVEPAESSRASFFVRDQAGIDDLLRMFLDLRPSNGEASGWR